MRSAGRLAGILFPSRSTALWYQILGPLEVHAGDGTVNLGPPKQRALLATLLLHHDQVVTTTLIEEALWGDEPPRTGSHSIQTYVSGLRRALGEGAIITTTTGYRVDLSNAELDAVVFEGLAAAAADAAVKGHSADVFRISADALQLWRGEPLTDVELSQTMSGRLQRLNELRMQSVERWADVGIALSRHDQVVAELEHLTNEHPLRESLWALRMRALRGSGRVAEALRVYQNLRGILGEELGIEPSGELRRLEEAILLGEPVAATGTVPASRNPYKGLRPFLESDAENFFGRDRLIRELIDAVDDPGRQMVAVVGPSGSGKSSVVRAGLIPALRHGALPGSELWEYLVSQPGPHPLEELHTGLIKLAGGEPASLQELCDRLHLEGRRLLLTLDQFEEVFTATEHETASRFLDLLAEAVRHPALRLVVTLRADYYDRPLLHPALGRLFASSVVHVHPLAADELSVAAIAPARGVGVELEPALVSEILSDVSARAGGLPLFQYALTEMFDRRDGATLSLSVYHAIGGVRGALTSRAEDVYRRLGEVGKVAARQVLLRLVEAQEGGRTSRRRVVIKELQSLPIEPSGLDEVLDRFGRYRLLSFDRDSATGEPTIEVAHEALLEEWPRLGTWIEEARGDLRRRASLAAARDEWVDADRDPGYLLTSSRLEQYEKWADESSIELTASERGFLEDSIRARNEQQEAEARRLAMESQLRRRASLRTWSLILLPVLTVAIGLFIYLGSNGPQIATMGGGGGDLGIDDLFEAGVARAEHEHGIEIARIEPLVDPAEDIARLCRSGSDLILLSFQWFGYASLVSEECSATRIAAIDVAVDESFSDETLLVTFNAWEGSFLAGAAASLKTNTGVVGFVGVEVPAIAEFLLGFQSGVAAVNPEVEVQAVWVSSFGQPVLGRAAADVLIAAGADVVYHAAGSTGDGVLEAVTEANAISEGPIWFIGVDVDEALTSPPASRPYVLTSMVKRIDTAIVDAVGAVIDGDFSPGVAVYGAANEGVRLATTGGHIDDILPELQELQEALVRGDELPEGESVELRLEPQSTHTGTLTFQGEECSFEGPTSLTEGDVLEVHGPANPDAFGSIVVEAAPGTPFTTSPIPRMETPPELDVASATVAPRPEVLTFPAFAGSWWVGCIFNDSMYPAMVIEVGARD